MSNNPLNFSLPIADNVPSLPNKFNVVLGTFGLANLKPKFYKVGHENADEFTLFSDYGTPIVSNLTFLPGSYIDDNGNKITWEGLSIDTVLFDVNRPSLIVETPVQGRDGTVKEYISKDDYFVTIRGALVSKEARVYPKDDFNRLITILNQPVALEILSDYLKLFSINNLVVFDSNFPQREGFYNMQIFELRCKADAPIEFIL